MSVRMRFGLYSPSGVVIEPEAIDRATRRLRDLGHDVIEDEATRARHQRFAGDDESRLAAIRRIVARDDIDVALATRGGYGWSRLLDRLDYRSIAQSGKRWMGHSDFTAFQLAVLAQAGLVTYAGPMAAYDFGATEPSRFTLTHAMTMLTEGDDEVSLALEGPSCAVEGTLWGGNLAIVAHLVGTPYLPAIEGGILFLEDIAEHPYRIERMMYQLLHAGVLRRQRAVLLGQFTDYALYPHDAGYDLAVVVAHFRERLDIPVLTGLPFGHVRDKLTLPIGGRATLRVHEGEARLTLRDCR